MEHNNKDNLNPDAKNRDRDISGKGGTMSQQKSATQEATAEDMKNTNDPTIQRADD